MTAINEAKAKLAVDSLESVLRMAENRRTRPDVSDNDSSAWCLVSIEASKALLLANSTPTASSIGKGQLEAIADSLQSVAEFSIAKARTTVGFPKGSALTLSKQRWAGITVEAYSAYLTALQLLGKKDDFPVNNEERKSMRKPTNLRNSNSTEDEEQDKEGGE